MTGVKIPKRTYVLFNGFECLKRKISILCINIHDNVK
jgi:hypothetical protein